MAKLNFGATVKVRQAIPALYDVEDPAGLILLIAPRSRDSEVAFGRQLRTFGDNVDARTDDYVNRIDSEVVGWQRMTPATLHALCRGTAIELLKSVAELEADLSAQGETEYEFDLELYLALLNNNQQFRDRIYNLTNSLEQLAKAEEAVRLNASASGSSTGEPARA